MSVPGLLAKPDTCHLTTTATRLLKNRQFRNREPETVESAAKTTRAGG
jgi:hypothetical protein